MKELMISNTESEKMLDHALEFAEIEALSSSTVQTLSAFRSKVKDIYKKAEKASEFAVNWNVINYRLDNFQQSLKVSPLSQRSLNRCNRAWLNNGHITSNKKF